MKFNELIEKTATLSCFRTSFLAAGRDLSQLRLQLNRWVQDKKIIRLTRGVYSLSEPYIKIKPDLYSIAAVIKPASYISLQSALSFHGLIPEHLYQHIGVTAGRGQEFNTPLMDIKFFHIQRNLFWGYRTLTSQMDQPAFMASAEKAFLDLIYFTPGAIGESFIQELRLQNLENLDCKILKTLAKRFNSHKIETAAEKLIHFIKNEKKGNL